MERKNLYITVGVVVVAVVVVVGVAVFVKQPFSSYTPAGGTSGGANAPSGPVTRTAAPANVTVPSAGATNVPQDVAVPKTVAPGNSAGTTSFRSFQISAQNNAFTPDTVIVYAGDTVDINITAVDKNYDFTLPDYGFKVPIPKGSTEKVQFAASASGQFLFYCTICGGPASGPRGYVIAK